jgi:hypothetical protein
VTSSARPAAGRPVLIHELTVIDKKIEIANAELTGLVDCIGSTLQDVTGIGPSGAARLLGNIGRFAGWAHFASWNGTARRDAEAAFILHRLTCNYECIPQEWHGDAIFVDEIPLLQRSGSIFCSSLRRQHLMWI